jgi:hypothetical protein
MSEASMIEKDRPGSAGWAMTPLLGQLPGDPGTERRAVRSPEGDQRQPGGREGGPNRPRSSLAMILAYAVAGGAIVLGIEIVVALASIDG